MKKFIIGFVLEAVFDALITALGRLAARSSSKVDDKLVRLIKKERSDIVKEIKQSI